MSILPVLGHKPITSYFSRTSSAKRKQKEVDRDPPECFSKKPKQSTCRSSLPHGLNAPKREKVDFPCPPLVSHPWKQSLDGTLLIPPLACIALPRHKAQRGQRDELEDTSLPTPTTPPRLSTHTSYQPSASSNAPEFIIPSSQSQDSQSMEVDMLAPFSKMSGNFLRPIEGERIIIESSQSQFLIMASPHVQKLELVPTLPSFDIVIPSSQSQEEELTIPTEKDTGRYPIVTAQKGFEFQRNLSRESFSVPIRDSILDTLLSDEKELNTPPAGNTPVSVNPVTLADSETEDEYEGPPNSFCKERSLDPSAVRSSGDSESSLGIGSYSSLPPEVWEFRKMFENGDESYPADFPESLRS